MKTIDKITDGEDMLTKYLGEKMYFEKKEPVKRDVEYFERLGREREEAIKLASWSNGRRD